MIRRHLGLTLAIAALVLGALLVPATAAAATPANDDFANATVISSLPFSDSVDATDATDAGVSEPQPCYRASHTIWYAYTASQAATLRADALGGLFDTTLTVYQGGGLSSVGCTAFGGSVSFDVQAGATYYFQLGSFFGGGGAENLNVALLPPPANDDFANANVAGSLPFSDTVDTAAATTEVGEPSPTCFGSSKTVWYAFTPTASGSYTASSNVNLAAYTGGSLGSLTEVGCRNYGPLTFSADAGTTYYFQEAGYGGGGVLQFGLDVTPPPTASFYYYPGSPSAFDTVQFYDQSYDPGQVGLSSEVWDFGDGTGANNPGCCPSHRYAKDGDYTVTLNVTTTDGRTASTQQVVHVRTHDVTIAKVIVPQTASVGQTRPISVGLTNSRYPETVQVQLLKSVAGGGWQQVGLLTQYVPVRGANRTTNFNFNYTFAPEDGALGKVNFQAVATIQGVPDAIPADNTFISLPTKVNK